MKKRGNLSEFHSERNYYLQNWYFRLLLCKTERFNQDRGLLCSGSPFRMATSPPQQNFKYISLGDGLRISIKKVAQNLFLGSNSQKDSHVSKNSKI